MADAKFEDPRLVAVYDAFDGDRGDLDLYVGIAKEFGAKSVLDVGCGTGSLAVRLAGLGYEVTGLEPASASVEIARRKPLADRVRWIVGDATALPPMKVDLAVMTGNVAQVFVSDQAWEETLTRIHKVLAPGGHFVFETRDPAKKAWLNWDDDEPTRLHVDGVGHVNCLTKVTSVTQGRVSFHETYTFESDGQVVTSESTLRFRERDELEWSLAKTGFKVLDVRDAPDRPGFEFVFVVTPAPLVAG